jgi:hypothetical protein
MMHKVGRKGEEAKQKQSQSQPTTARGFNGK